MQNQQLEQLSLAEAKALLPVLQQAQHELEVQFRRWVGTPGNDERFTAQHLRNARLAVNHAMVRLGGMAALAEVAEMTIGSAGMKSIQLSVLHLRDEVARFSSMFDGSVHAISLNEAAIVARGERMLIPRMRTSAARYVGDIRRDIQNRLAVGHAKNQTFEQMTRELVRHGGPRGVVAVRGVAGEAGSIVERIPEGLFRRYRYWGERIVRTESVNAYNETHKRSIRELAATDPAYLERWDASVDRRICPICRGLDGQTTEPGREFRGGYLRPPAHPCCRCALVPWKAHWPDLHGMGPDEPGDAPTR